jgi:hypothetical protein
MEEVKGTQPSIYRVQGGLVITIVHPKMDTHILVLALSGLREFNLFYHLWHLFVRILLQICDGSLNLAMY